MIKSFNKSKSRNVVIGQNSKVWLALKDSQLLASSSFVAISHAELTQFDFQVTDTVWVLSYSKVPKQNESLIDFLATKVLAEIVYITSASTNVSSVTNCYRYPKVKRLAEKYASEVCNAYILTIGLFYVDKIELPSGCNVVTHLNDMAAFMNNFSREDSSNRYNLFKIVQVPFSTKFESFLYKFYGLLQESSGSFPCLLRPVDILLRLFKLRWYGYLYLSNKLWSMTT